MSDPRSLPVGSTTTRQDGKTWQKTAHGKDFKYVGKGKSTPGSEPGPQDLQPGEAWQQLVKTLKLDGHVPPDAVHASHVQVDVEGDIDTKPVLTWTDPAGNVHNTYTREFHNRKAHSHTLESKEHYEDIEKAFHLAETTLMSGGSTDPTDALVCAHLITGHRVADLLGLKGAHASVDGGVDYNPSRPRKIEKSEHGVSPGDTLCIHGVEVVIETPAGYVRRGVDADGNEWETTLPWHYGHIPGTTGVDGEEVDVIINPNGVAGDVVVVNQARTDTGGMDEQKVMLLFSDPLDAVRAYTEVYPFGAYRGHYAMSRADFLGWVMSGERGEVQYQIAKSYTSQIAHPHRVTAVMTHPHGHVYPTHLVNQHVADYVMQHAAPAEPLFNTTREQVDARLKSLGIDHIPESAVRHMATRRIAADVLSKMDTPDVATPDGLEQLTANLGVASDEIATRFGHPPAPEGMSYVHPHVAAAYAEQANGAALWPKAFSKSETAECTSPKPPEASSLEAMISRTAQSHTTPTSPLPASAPEQKTPTAYRQRSLSIRGQPWWLVADKVEEELGRPWYEQRLPPLEGAEAPRYYHANQPVEVEDIVAGTVLRISANTLRIVEVLGNTCALERAFFEDDKEAVRGTWEVVDGEFIFTPALDFEKSFKRDADTALGMYNLNSKRKRNWKVARMLSRISGLARKARKGDLNAVTALRTLLDAIGKEPGGEVAAEMDFAKSETVLEDLDFDLDFDVYLPNDGGLVLYFAKGERGPEGDPIGTIREHADGGKWEKRDDGWHQIGEHADRGGGDKPAAGASGKAPAGKAAQEPADASVLFQQGQALLQKLRAMWDATVDPTEKRVLAEQIAIVRNRIAGMQKKTYAGQTAPDNITQERQVAKSEVAAAADAYPVLRAACAEHRSVRDVVEYLADRGTLIEKSEWAALGSSHGTEGRVAVVRGWLR